MQNWIKWQLHDRFQIRSMTGLVPIIHIYIYIYIYIYWEEREREHYPKLIFDHVFQCAVSPFSHFLSSAVLRCIHGGIKVESMVAKTATRHPSVRVVFFILRETAASASCCECTRRSSPPRMYKLQLAPSSRGSRRRCWRQMVSDACMNCRPCLKCAPPSRSVTADEIPTGDRLAYCCRPGIVAYRLTSVVSPRRATSHQTLDAVRRGRVLDGWVDGDKAESMRKVTQS